MAEGDKHFLQKKGVTNQRTAPAPNTETRVPAAIVASKPKKEEDSRKIVSSETIEENGKYRVFFQVFDGKKPIPGAMIRITAQETNEVLLTTDENGEARCTIIVCGKELVCLVTLVGTDVSVCKNFFKSERRTQ